MNDDSEYYRKLKELSKTTEVKLFKKNNNKWILRDSRIIIHECNKMKQKLVRQMSTNLKSISQKKNIDSNNIKNINDKTISDISTIDNIMSIVQNNNEEYIETFSNDYECLFG